MVRNQIKVVKRNKKDELKIKQVVVNLAKDETDIKHKLVNAVSSWIAERRENSRLEKIFSERNVSAWKNKSAKIPESVE